jgi:hypothetical protein
MGSVSRPAVRSTARETGPDGNGVEKTGAVVGVAKREADGLIPQAVRVTVPAPIPINLIKSLRVSFLIVKFSFYVAILSI